MLFAFLPNIGGPELIILGILAVLLFGSRLPEVARNLGKGVTEFKKGLRNIEGEIDDATRERRVSHYDEPIDEREAPTAPKFEPPKSEPHEVAETPTVDATPHGNPG
ncbi:MAG: twin-arginine translocase TatA/TatE family subunit [Pirellulales bacterium]|nr:twin-arginine translocase TatA/TatE family subunit [Pirellulales bacterium]